MYLRFIKEAPDYYTNSYLLLFPLLVFFFLFTSTKYLLPVFLQFLLPSLRKMRERAYDPNSRSRSTGNPLTSEMQKQIISTSFILSSKSARALEPFFFFSSCSFTSSLIYRTNRRMHKEIGHHNLTYPQLIHQF